MESKFSASKSNSVGLLKSHISSTVLETVNNETVIITLRFLLGAARVGGPRGVAAVRGERSLCGDVGFGVAWRVVRGAGSRSLRFGILPAGLPGV